MPRPSLYLISPPVGDPEEFRAALAEACGTGLVAALLLRLVPRDERALVKAIKALAPVAQDHGTAVIVADPGPDIDLARLVLRGGADGGHAGDLARLPSLREHLKDGLSLGAGGLRTRHDAMVAGEAEVDYVLFGEENPDGSLPPLDLAAEQAAWWAEIFQTPCAVFAPTWEAVPRLAATGAEFIALGDMVWSHAEGPASALARIERLAGAPRKGAA